MLLTDQKSSEVAERIRSAVEDALASRNLSARRASMDVVGHDGLIRDIRAGRIPSADRIEALFNYLGLEAYFGPKRSGPNIDIQPQVANHRPEDDSPAGFLTIPWVDPTPGQGSAPVAFSRAWLQLHGLVPDFLAATHPDSVNLSSVPMAESLALLDTRVALRQGHGVWCLRVQGQVLVSRVTFKGSVTVVLPADADQEPLIIEGPSAGAVTILGKVVWLGQSIPFRGIVK
jgi:hypothetical protein